MNGKKCPVSQTVDAIGFAAILNQSGFVFCWTNPEPRSCLRLHLHVAGHRQHRWPFCLRSEAGSFVEGSQFFASIAVVKNPFRNEAGLSIGEGVRKDAVRLERRVLSCPPVGRRVPVKQ